MTPLERLGVAIADADIAWTAEMRSAWDAAKNIEAKCRCEQLTRCLFHMQSEAVAHCRPLSDDVVSKLWSWSMTADAEVTATTQQHAFARAIELAHGITPPNTNNLLA
jgi:hypothetical protein